MDTSKWQIFNIGLNGAQWGSMGLNRAQWGSIGLNRAQRIVIIPTVTDKEGPLGLSKVGWGSNDSHYHHYYW